MADQKISDLADGGAAQATDELVVARSGSNISLKGNVFDAAGAAAAAQAASQPLDSDLTAIAALSTTSFGRALLTAADAAGLRTTAGVVIGTNVEAWDADLDDIAALTPTNDDVVQRKAGHWTNRTMAQLIADLAALGTTFQPLDSDLTSIAALSTTSYGRGLLTLANAAAADWITNALVDAKGDLISASADDTPARLAVGTNGYPLLSDSAQTLGLGYATRDMALNSHKITGLAAGSGAGDALRYEQVLGANVLAVANLVAGAAGQVLGGTGPAYAYPPGYEIGYTEITSNASVTDTSESTATALISPGALTFDGGPVLLEFFAPVVIADSTTNTDILIITIFEGATQIGRLAEVRTTVVGTPRTSVPVRCTYRFTPSAASHTYKLCAFATSATGGTIIAGAGGTAGFVPAFVRFTKV